ncbi:hypothetical protein PoB_002734200 [Plakobranchus ocellatus]|uniref:Uncharacterized protein n=1 Tax=Plakobranchus ocellatus TaxID=259542 RepID=A0AAV4A1U3_9GAST|nr:hypothetical protein PoB_002734200 [Plakobranchus ocellatus]
MIRKPNDECQTPKTRSRSRLNNSMTISFYAYSPGLQQDDLGLSAPHQVRESVAGSSSNRQQQGPLDSASALRSAGTLVSQVRVSPLLPWLDGGPKSLRSPCCGLATHIDPHLNPLKGETTFFVLLGDAGVKQTNLKWRDHEKFQTHSHQGLDLG